MATQKEDLKLVFKTVYRLMQVKSIAECILHAILSTFIKLPFIVKTFVLSIFEWPFKTGFTEFHSNIKYNKIQHKHHRLYVLDNRERSGSVVECLTGDRGTTGSSLTGVTALWSLSKTHLS